MIKSNLNESLNEFGNPIWENELDLEPKQWNIYRENEDHFFISYIHKSDEIINYDPIIHEIQKYRLTAIINYRIHLDHSILIEISARNSSSDRIKFTLKDIEEKFGIKDISYKMISHEHIEIFDGTAEQITHEKREGIDATTALTRVNKYSDTRNDALREDLIDREFRKEHGVLKINNNKYLIGLVRGNKGKIQIRRYIPPKEQIKVMHEIFNIFGW
jgi:metal-responsive CopG/Arc/MetJ family transcriptional regulator